MDRKLSTTEFVLAGIDKLRGTRRDGVAYKGIHSVFTGFNAAFREYFPGQDPVEVTTQLAEEGTIVVVPSKGGAMLYRPENAPANRSAESRSKAALAAIIGQ